MNRITLEASNYRSPELREHPDERCRDCAEKIKSRDANGNNIECAVHQVQVRHSYRCDQWHKPGTLFA